MTDTPIPGTTQPQPPATDRFGLAVLVTRLMADVAVLKDKVDGLEDEDEKHEGDLATLKADVSGLKEQFSRLHVEIKAWRDASTTATAGLVSRLTAVERKITGATGILVLLEIAIEAYKSANGH